MTLVDYANNVIFSGKDWETGNRKVAEALAAFDQVEAVMADDPDAAAVMAQDYKPLIAHAIAACVTTLDEPRGDEEALQAVHHAVDKLIDGRGDPGDIASIRRNLLAVSIS